MQLQEILHAKGSTVHSIRPQATLAEAVETLVQRNCGSLVVVEAADARRMLGIITERDVLRSLAKHGPRFDQLLVSDVMTRNVITGHSSDTVEDTMGLMTDHRVRHLPLVEDGALVGIISIGDVVKAQHDALSMENHYLKTYIQS